MKKKTKKLAVVANSMRPFDQNINRAIGVAVVAVVLFVGLVAINSTPVVADVNDAKVSLNIASESGALQVTDAPWIDVRESVLGNLASFGASVSGAASELLGRTGTEFPHGLINLISISTTTTQGGEINLGTTVPLKEQTYVGSCTDATSLIFGIENPYTSTSTANARIVVTGAASTTEGVGVATEISVGTSTSNALPGAGLFGGGLVDAFVTATGTLGVIKSGLGVTDLSFVNQNHAAKSVGNFYITVPPKDTAGSWVVGEATTTIAGVQQAGQFIRAGTNDGIQDSSNTFACTWAVTFENQ